MCGKNFKRGIFMNLLFSYWAKAWLNAIENEVKPSALNEYQSVVRSLMKYFDGFDMYSITPKRVQELLDELHSKGQAKSTIVKRKYNIQQIFRYASLNGLEISNPCSFARVPRKAAKKQRRPLTEAEIALVMLERNNDSYGFYAFMLLYTGLRRSEMLALTWEDIDFINNVIHVNKVVIYANGKAIIDEILKNGDEERLLPMPQILVQELKKHATGKHGLIFGRSENLPVNPNAHSWNWEKYRKRIGLEATQHMFRHTYCTMLYEADVDVKTAAYLMGHRDINTTLAIYTHLEKEKAAKAAMQKLNRFIGCMEAAL